MILLLTILLLLISLLLVWKGSDWLTDSMIPVAQKLGTSYVAVTTLIVSFMLSIPEIFTSIYAYFLGHVTLGLGVIIGSVMANIGLTVGLSASFMPLSIDKYVVIRDGIYMVVVAAIVLLFGSDLTYQRSEGFVLLLLFVPYALNVWFSEKQKSHTYKKEKIKTIKEHLELIRWLPQFKLTPSLWTFGIGVVLLLGGSYLFSFSLIELSEQFQFSELLLGLTVGALGLALPNIAAAIQGTRQGMKDAAITETFGSNIITMLVALGIIILLSPIKIKANVFYFDLTWMIIIHLLMVAFIFKGYEYREESLTRYEGAALVLFYVVLVVLQMVLF